MNKQSETNYKTAAEYCQDFSKEYEALKTEKKLQWDPDAVSDHEIIIGEIRGHTVMSWNLLNQQWINYTLDTSADGQRLHNHKMFQPTFASKRLILQPPQILGLLEHGGIVFLQEVDMLMSSYISMCCTRMWPQ